MLVFNNQQRFLDSSCYLQGYHSHINYIQRYSLMQYLIFQKTYRFFKYIINHFMQSYQDMSFLQLPQKQKGDWLCHLFNEKRLYQFITKCQLLINKGISLEQLTKKFQLKVQLAYQYSQMKRRYNKALELIQISRQSDEGWKNIQADQNCSLSLKLTGTILQLKSRGTIHCNIKNIFIVVYLIKLYNECIPFCKQAVEICQPSKLQKIGMINMSFPIPFVKDRCLFIRGLGIDRTRENGTACIFAQGINDDEKFLENYKINVKETMKKRQLLDIKHFAIELKYIDEKITQYSAYAKVDHKLALVPEGVLLLIAKECGVFIFRKLMKKLLNFDSTVWAKQVKQNYGQNAQFYDWLNKKFAQQSVLLKNKPKI